MKQKSKTDFTKSPKELVFGRDKELTPQEFIKRLNKIHKEMGIVK